ncbi:MAG: hypothetical protein ACJ769_06000, partial [Chloroflexota bacterium]
RFSCDNGATWTAWASSNTGSCSTNDNGTRNVKGEIRDKDLDASTYSAAITVNNVAPTATFNNNGPVNEGSNINLSLTAVVDPGSADTFEYRFSCDGTTWTAWSSSNTYACPTNDNGTRSVKGQVKDDDGGASPEYLATVTINNVAPSIAISGSGSVSEGSAYSLTLGAVTDPGNDTVTSYIVHWGDGTDSTYTSNGVKTHTYADGPATRAVTVDLIDEDGTFLNRANPHSVTVNNVAPSIAVSGSGSVNEGSSYSLTLGAVTDPGTDTVTGYVVHWGDGLTNAYTTNGVKTHVYADGPATRAVTVDLVDEDGTFLDRANAHSVTVNNVGPIITSLTSTQGAYPIGTAVTVTGNFTDPGVDAPWACTVDWDNGQGPQPGTVDQVNKKCTATKALSGTGVYTITMTVTDKDGASDNETIMIAIYDPSAGFVTGGGFINVGTGSYAADPTLSGRANFGFNSQYKKNAMIPTGETEFNFQVGDMNFHSTAYTWLVVSGYKAQYKGTGTINGSGNYDFTLTAYDGQISGGGGTDKFRMRITDGNNGNAVIFDNRNGALTDMDVADPQAISGGSIVIHKA